MRCARGWCGPSRGSTSTATRRSTEEEFLRPTARMVERLDRDGDGVVTREELPESMRERRQAMHGRHGGRGGEHGGERRGSRN